MNKNHKYLSLIFIVISSIGTTILISMITNFLRLHIIPFYDNCYKMFVHIDKVNNKLLYIDLFYSLFFIVYFILFIFILIKIIKRKKMKNIYSTVIILTIFNAILLGMSFYGNVEMRKVSITWCEFTQEGCISSYKTLHEIDRKSSQIIKLDLLKPCFDNPTNYFEKSLKKLQTKKNL